MIEYIKITVVLVCVLLISACETTAPYDYTQLIEHKPRSILVLPPANNSVEVNAPYTFLSTISQPLAEKGYYVFPVAVVDTYMKENGLPTPEDMHAVPLDKLREQFGADSVLYVTIQSWGQSYQVLSSKAEVKATVRLVDARSGEKLWSGTAYAVQESSDGGGGLAGALIGAVITQIAGSVVDYTPQLSKTANSNLINNKNNGLLFGPYAPNGVEPFEPTAAQL